MHKAMDGGGGAHLKIQECTSNINRDMTIWNFRHFCVDSITYARRANAQLGTGCGGGGGGEAVNALWLVLNNITQRVRADINITISSKGIKLKIHNHVVYGKRNVHTKNENCISIINRDMTIWNFHYFSLCPSLYA